MSRHTQYLLFAGLVLSTLSACAGFYPLTYSSEAIEAKVVDAETKQPIEGVVVVAHWTLLAGIEGNSPTSELMVLETVSDAQGHFAFPAWGPKLRGWGYLRDSSPQVLFFKSGYDYRSLMNSPESGLNRDSDSLRRSEWNGKRIEMKRFVGTETEYALHLSSLHTAIRTILVNTDDCQWKKMPRLMLAVDKLKQEFRSHRIINPLYSIGDLSSGGHCGSSTKYFDGFMP